MTIKSQSNYICPDCGLEWLPYTEELHCPRCGRVVSAFEVAPILSETLESAQFNKRLYGKIALEFWIPHRLGDHYLEWAFAALDAAEKNPDATAEDVALNTMVSLDLAEMGPYRAHVMGFLTAAIEAYRADVAHNPEKWVKMPEPEKPFFGRKIIED